MLKKYNNLNSIQVNILKKRFIKHNHDCFATQDYSTDLNKTRLTGSNARAEQVYEMTGEGLSSRGYAPYGSQNQQNSSYPNYTGERCDPVLCGYHLGNGYRVYLPKLMRFISPDHWSPFGLGGINPYVYCNSDPMNSTDPSGHMSAKDWTNIGVSILSILFALATGGYGSILSIMSLAASVLALGSKIASVALHQTHPELADAFEWMALACFTIAIALGGVNAAIVGYKKRFPQGWIYKRSGKQRINFSHRIVEAKSSETFTVVEIEFNESKALPFEDFAKKSPKMSEKMGKRDSVPLSKVVSRSSEGPRGRIKVEVLPFKTDTKQIGATYRAALESSTNKLLAKSTAAFSRHSGTPVQLESENIARTLGSFGADASIQVS